MTADIYAQAGYEALLGGMTIAKVLSRLKEVLDARGHSSLYKVSLEGILARVEKAEAGEVAHVTVANKGAEKHFANELKQFLKEEGMEHSLIHIDETIIGGYIIEGNGKREDASYKNSLLTIYKSLVK